MLTFGTRIILLLLIIGGIIAYIGDYIGRSIGRKRLSIFRLRPRYTALAFTVITGALITITTLGIILAISQDARTALFGLQELRAEVADKSQLLEKTKDELSLKVSEMKEIDKTLEEARHSLKKAGLEIKNLEITKKQLEQRIVLARQGDVLFNVGDVLMVSVIQAGPEKEKLEIGLKQILSAADAHLRNYGIEKEEQLIIISPDNFDKAVNILQKRLGENIVKVICLRNIIFGEKVPVRFEIVANQRIYKGGKVIAELAIVPSLSLPEIEQELKKLLSITNISAKQAGVIPDPSGSMGSIPYSKILSLAKKIKAHKKGVIIKTLAKNDVYSLGPLTINFRTYYQ